MRVGSDAAPAAGRGRYLPHWGGAGAPPGGHYEPPARSMATGTPAASFAIAANTPGTTDGNRKARPAL